MPMAKCLSVLVLGRAIATAHPFRAQLTVFGVSPCYPFAPEPEAARLELTAHQANDVFFPKTIQVFYGLEGRAVLPRHFDDAGEVCWVKLLGHGASLLESGIPRNTSGPAGCLTPQIY